MDKQKILLVEDDALLRKLYSDLLSAEGFIVDTASDGLIAYEKIKQGNWNLVLLDIMLPKLNGLELVKKLKAENALNAGQKLVFLSNLDTGNEIDEIKTLGFDHVVKSNLAPDQFIAKIKNYLL